MSFDSTRITVHDYNLAIDFGKSIVFGQAFAFLPGNCLEHTSMAWVGSIFGAADFEKPRILSLLGEGPISMPGFDIEPLQLPSFKLASITCDKDVYEPQVDLVHLLIVYPDLAGARARLEVCLNGSVFLQPEVELGIDGTGQLTLSDLPVGEYSVCLESESESELSAKFLVSEFRLVPLVALLRERRRETSDRLSVALDLASYGEPVNGQVTVQVLESGVSVAVFKETAVKGRLNLSLKLEGEGQLVLNLQLVKDTSKTATVPLTGTRASERSQTLFSSLGLEVTGSLLPPDSDSKSVCVRGIYLESGAVVNSPLSLERVDADRARLKVNCESIAALKVVTIRPGFPVRRADAVDPKTARHPALDDEYYQKGEKQFEDGRNEEAFDLIVAGRMKLARPHPYYSYLAGCCLARLGRSDEAISFLRQSLEDGWNEMRHMKEDPDLDSLKDLAEYKALIGGFYREQEFVSLSQGDVIDIEGEGPLSLISIGALIDGKAWEGWAALLAPEALSLDINLPEKCRPGKKLSIEVLSKNGRSPSSVYLVVKDARLISSDNPQSRLATRMKLLVEKAGAGFGKGNACTTGEDCIQMLESGQWMDGGWGASPTGGGWGTAPQSAQRFQSAIPNANMIARSGGLSGGMDPADIDGSLLQTLAGSTMRARIAEGVAFGLAPAGAGLTLPRPVLETAEPLSADLKVFTDTQPQVLFSGFVPMENGKAVLELILPDEFCDYLVETFACVGKQWRYGEARFRAEKYPFVALSLPVFAGIGEGVRGSLYAGSKAMDVSVELFRQATRVELESSGGADSDVLNGGIFKFDFECSPGFYEAVLKDSSGAVLERTAGIVNEPGKLKRRVHGLRLLEAGESIALTDDASIRSLRLLPGLSTSFALLVEATSDYSHCCCEQTAAKTLAACSMYMLASGDGGRKDKAESIIIAGIRRQESMWLEGRGFKSYPDYPSNPDQHYGPIASRHLWNLDLLLSGGKDLSPELKKWLGKGIEIARDTSVAYGIEMVPSDLKSCQDAYSAIRFANGNDNKSRSIEFIRRQLAKGTQDRRLPIIESSFHFLGGQVSYRIECAYAAAALIKAGESQDRRVALDLANEVISCFNEESRLYSTVDSVAAIALMSELEAARITGGGVVQFDGKELSISDALLSRTSPEKVKVVDGVAAVEVVKEVVEDWGSFSAGVAMRVALMTGGKVKRSFVPGELVELNIRLEDGCEEGDLIWVCLPEALSRLVGGGQVKLFSVDLKGRSELAIPLVVSGSAVSTVARTQKFAVCLRNMFNEDRSGSPGLLEILVSN